MNIDMVINGKNYDINVKYIGAAGCSARAAE
jgi:hypothetical protein